MAAVDMDARFDPVMALKLKGSYRDKSKRGMYLLENIDYRSINDSKEALDHLGTLSILKVSIFLRSMYICFKSWCLHIVCNH